MGFSGRAVAIVPAAGSGERMRSPGILSPHTQSKLLYAVGGNPILARTLGILSDSGLFESILVPCRDSDREQFAPCAGGITIPVQFFTGGSTRQESVRRALQHLHESDRSTKDLIVMVHDAARCFVSKELIERSLAAARVYKAISAAISCIDTVYQIDENADISSPLLERSRLRSIQTPQTFDFELLWQAHNSTSIQCSDDAGLVAAIHAVRLIEGEVSNYKITTIEDLERARIATD